MPLTSVAAAMLTIVGMAAAAGGRRHSRILAATGVGAGAVMLAALALPECSVAAASGILLGLLVLTLLALLWARMQCNRPWLGWQKSAAVLVIVDVWFMALSLLFMRVHETGMSQTITAEAGSTSGHASHGAVSGGLWGPLLLVDWALCAAVLIVPAFRLRMHHAYTHATCSVCMILAMAMMAL